MAVEELTFKTKHDEWQYSNWTKDDIYKAYLLEYEARMTLSKECNRLNRKLAEVRHLVGCSNN